MVDLLSIDEAVSGMAGITSFGVRPSTTSNSVPTTNVDLNEINDENQIDIQMELDSLIEDAVNDDCVPTRKIPKKTLDRDSLLQKQVENQILFHEKTTKILSNINMCNENTIKTLTEINENIAGVQKYIRRNYEVQDRMYKLEKEKFEFTKKYEMEKSKRKMEQLQLKKRIFELELEKHNLKK